MEGSEICKISRLGDRGCGLEDEMRRCRGARAKQVNGLGGGTSRTLSRKFFAKQGELSADNVTSG